MSEDRGSQIAPRSSQRSSSRSAIRARRYAFLSVALLAGCSLLHSGPTIVEPIHLIAVMPIERAQAVGGPAASAATTPPDDRYRLGDRAEPVRGTGLSADVSGAAAGTSALSGTQQLLPGAERVVTAQIYGALSNSPRWRFVPDLTVSQALGKIDPGGDLAARASALGKAVGADAVLCGTVSRYVEREGAEYGAKQAAAVAFSLQLVSVSSGRVLWKGSFDQQQQPLSTNLFNWWQFWQGGPKWFSAQEFTRLGVEHLLDDLAKQLGS
jgi:peptidoglycan-synthase activator LpoB